MDTEGGGRVLCVSIHGMQRRMEEEKRAVMPKFVKLPPHTPPPECSPVLKGFMATCRMQQSSTTKGVNERGV